MTKLWFQWKCQNKYINYSRRLLGPRPELHWGNHSFMDIFTMYDSLFSLTFPVVMYFMGNEPWRNMLQYLFRSIAVLMMTATSPLSILHFHVDWYSAPYKQNPQEQVCSSYTLSVFVWFYNRHNNSGSQRHTEALCYKPDLNLCEHNGLCV